MTIRQLRAQFNKRELTEAELQEMLRLHAVGAGLLDEAEQLSPLVADLTERAAEMCASVADLGGDGDAMFEALRTAEGILTSQEMLFAKFVVARCVAIALTHRRADEDEVGVAIRAGLCCVPDLVSLDKRRQGRGKRDNRREQEEFLARGERSWQEYQRNGQSVPVDEVFDRLQKRLDTRRDELRAKVVSRLADKTRAVEVDIDDL